MVLRSVGSLVTVTLNDAQIIDLDLLESSETQPFVDDKPALLRRSGLIGLQKHTGNVAFRNLQIKDLTQPASAVDGTLNYGDWIDLLEGNSLAAWQASPGTLKAQQGVSLTNRQFAQRTADALVRQHWQVRNGELQFSGLKAPSLSTRKSYTDFELSLDWKIAKVATAVSICAACLRSRSGIRMFPSGMMRRVVPAGCSTTRLSPACRWSERTDPSASGTRC